MNTQKTEDGQELPVYETLAHKIDHLLLDPRLSNDDVEEGCRTARTYKVASVLVRPSDVDEAVRWMEGSGVAVASTAGYPHGSSSTGTKLYEARDLIRRGVREIDFVLNPGKMISRQFQYVETELMQIAKSCAESGVKLKVDLNSSFLSEDLKIIALKICKRIEAGYITCQYDLREIALLQPLLKERMQMKVACSVETLAQAIEITETGCTRLGTSDTASILEDWKVQLESVGTAEG